MKRKLQQVWDCRTAIKVNDLITNDEELTDKIRFSLVSLSENLYLG